ncbi:hypothetical protein D3C81_1992720 [compost metagenome]
MCIHELLLRTCRRPIINNSSVVGACNAAKRARSAIMAPGAAWIRWLAVFSRDARLDFSAPKSIP